jgi:pimeloyl-ACP methyl ester carboxylesterase
VIFNFDERPSIDRFAGVGFSGGGPYALVCAYQIPHRLTACGTVARVGRISPFLVFLSQWLPWLVLPITRRFFRNKEQAQKALMRAARNWVEPDRKSIFLPGIKELMVASLVEALRPGARGAAHDGALLRRPWRFNLEEVIFPRIFLWHGELDKEVPVATGREVAGKLAQCKATYYTGEGHISLIVNHAQNIVQALI